MKHVELLMMLMVFLGISWPAWPEDRIPQTETVYLSGHGSEDAVGWDFYCTDGRNSKKWVTIPVPSNWELHGFGTYNYGHQKNKADEQGRYQTAFQVPSDWKDKRISIVFEGVMTDTEAWVNGRSVGPKHQGGFYQFEYDITGLVALEGPNLLEVTVSKVSSDISVEHAERQADYWVLGGIYRPVYLRAVPAEHIVRLAIYAKADGTFVSDVYLAGIVDSNSIKAEIFDEKGNLCAAFSTVLQKDQTRASLSVEVANPKTWTAETPSLYWLQVDLCCGDSVLHRIKEHFGFRTIEVVKDKGIYINGRRVVMKGVNRHSFWPDSGRALSRKICYDDAKLIKSMNMNAVRMSHYPPDKAFLEACDELGLYVVDELAGWQSSYDTDIGRKLLEDMVQRDINHPSVIFWSNGNEGGWNTELDDDFAAHDPQKRPVLHPFEKFSGIDTDHYKSYESTRQKIVGPLIFMPTEFLHGLYDGGLGAGLEDYWKLMGDTPFCGGGFLWALLDEGVVRTDQDGHIDVGGNWAPDGIVGPYRQKEGSYYTIKQIWSPIQIQIQLPPQGNRIALLIANQYSFTNANQTRLTWQLVNFPSSFSSCNGHIVERTGTVDGPDMKPGQTGPYELVVDENWRTYDALYLQVDDAFSNNLWTWSLPIQSRTALAGSENPSVAEQLECFTEEEHIIVSGKNYRYEFNKESGILVRVQKEGKQISFSNGPRLVFGKETSQQAEKTSANVKYYRKGGNVVISAKNSNGLEHFTWTVCSMGELALSYRYALHGEYDYFGISFDCPEAEMKGMRWLGQGPNRVWKNRLKGTWLDVWQRDYNRVVLGQAGDYPLFAGYYGDFYWLEVQTQAGPIRVFNHTDGICFRIGELLNGDKPVKETYLSPLGDLSFMHAISPIGDKFLKASDLGPTGQPNTADGIYSGELTLVF
ncbi:MAG: hypothetical protein L0Y36_09340 [Planctomycetales bacterium]|nr:hypothetical protein [Planctomycetales bacterium]